MQKYVKLSDIEKYPFRAKNKQYSDFIAGAESVIEYANNLPNYKTFTTLSTNVDTDSLCREIDYLENSGLGKKKSLAILKNYLQHAEQFEKQVQLIMNGLKKLSESEFANLHARLTDHAVINVDRKNEELHCRLLQDGIETDYIICEMDDAQGIEACVRYFCSVI